MHFVFALLIFSLLAAPGVRLLWVALRTGRAPELWGGLYFLGVALGVPMRVLGAGIFPSDPDLGAWLNEVGHVFFASGSAAMAIFVWRVFRPDARWATVAAVSAVLAVAVSTVGVFAAGAVNDEESRWILFTNLARLAPLLWAFVESVRYWRLMSRRRSLGLSDPVVANRFGLWAVWTGALSVLPTMSAGVRILRLVAREFGATLSATAELQASVITFFQVTAAVALPIGVVALWLSFFPPQAYLRWLTARDARAEAAV